MFYQRSVANHWKILLSSIMSQAYPYPVLSLMSPSMMHLHTQHFPTTGEIQLGHAKFLSMEQYLRSLRISTWHFVI